ncbi:MAG: LLM class F420-dependent oxidoreductase [Chloroflexota bacterium]|nr:LLM class F420-dependent oxidoreductase [Chloroflexota bacterium]
MVSRLGLSIPLDGLTLPECVELACQAEGLGYSDVWTSEIAGADGLSILGAVAVRTEHIRLGTGVIPVFTRPPALLAMSAAALQGLSEGRFCLGLGSSSEVVVNQWMGLELQSPLTRVRETVEAVRIALLGSKFSFDGETVRLEEFRLQLPVMEPIPVFLAAMGPRMLGLAGEIGDGVVLSHVALPAIPKLLAHFRAGMESAGREEDGLEVVQRVGVAIDEDDEVLLPALRRELAGYARTRAYNASFARQGYESEAQAARDGWERGDSRAAYEAISSKQVGETYIVGNSQACRDKLQAYREAGVTTPVILPISVHPNPEERKQRRLRVIEALAITA